MCDKRKSSRRSSILKPPKQRTPLCDVDFNPPTRRVSFANSNFIKEFTADPEKNTIWHNSYEESINSIKSSPDQEEMMYDASEQDDFNHTRLEFFEEENSLAKNSSDDSITSARIDLNNFKDQTPQNTGNCMLHEPPQFQEISYKKISIPGQQSSVSFLPNLEFSQMMGNEMSLRNIQDMSVGPSTSKQQTLVFDATASNDLDFAQAIPSNFGILKLSRQSSLRNVQDMPIGPSTSKQQTLLFDSTASNDLDFTQTIPSNFGNLKLSRQSSAEITRSIPPNSYLRRLINSRRQSNYKSDNMENVEMEITEVIPPGFSYTNTNRRTLPLHENLENSFKPDEILIQAEKENIPTTSKGAKNRQTIYFTNQNFEEAEIDMTETIPTRINLQNFQQISGLGNDINNEYMEMTTPFTSTNNFPSKNKIKTRRTTYFNPQSEEADMDMTITTPNAINVQQQSRLGNINKENMEITTLSKNNLLQQNRQNLEEDNVAQTNPNLQQIFNMGVDINNENMEITTAITTKNNFLSKNKNQNRQTINFKQNIENADMELTQSVPCDINLQLANENNAEKSINISKSDQKEQSLSYNEIKLNSTGENIVPQIDVSESNFATKKPCPSSIDSIINLQADKSIKLNDSTSLKITAENSDIQASNFISDVNALSSNECISSTESIQIISSNEVSQNLKESNDTNLVLNQITDLLKDRNTPDSMPSGTKENDNSENVEIEVIEKLETIFHFKGYPLVVNANPAANESGKSDICQRIKYLGVAEESFHTSKFNITSYSNANSCNVSKNLSSLVDSTEKLINYKPELVGGSEYTKIINEEIVFYNVDVTDKNPSLDISNVGGKRPSLENIDESSNVPHKIASHNITTNSNNIIEIHDDKTSTTETVEMNNTDNLSSPKGSIISINSSVESDTEDDSFVKEFNISDVKSPPKSDLLTCFINYPNAQNSIDISENEMWLSVVEKSRRDVSEMLSSFDISLVNSFENSQTSEPSSTEASAFGSTAEILDKILESINNRYFVPEISEPETNIDAANFNEKLKNELNETIKKPEIVPEIMTIEKQIKQKSKDALWSITELKNDVFNFTFMCDSLEAESQIDTETGIVKDVKFYSTVCEKTSDQCAVYCHHIVIKKLALNHIKSAIGSSYTILSLLDYISLLEEKNLENLDHFEYLELHYGIEYIEDLSVNMNFTNLYLIVSFEVIIDTSKLDNMTEEDVIVKPLVNRIDSTTIKRMIKGCPTGVPLLKQFILNVEEYLKFLEKNRRHNSLE